MEAEDGVPYLEMQQSIQELACAVRHCAPSLRILRLRLFQTTSFRDYETDAFHPDGLHSLLVRLPTSPKMWDAQSSKSYDVFRVVYLTVVGCMLRT